MIININPLLLNKKVIKIISAFLVLHKVKFSPIKFNFGNRVCVPVDGRQSPLCVQMYCRDNNVTFEIIESYSRRLYLN